MQNQEKRDFHGMAVQWLRIHLPMQGAQFQSPVRELRSQVLHGMAKTKKKKKKEEEEPSGEHR